MSTTPRTALPLLAAAQAQKHVTHNEALLQLDALLFARLLDRDLSAPPGSPADGDTYLVKATATGAWTGQNGKLAYASSGAWRFFTPFTGLAAYVVDESKLIVFDGTNWVDYASILVLQNVPLLGVNTTADATNKLAVKSTAILFDNTGNGVQAKLNKHAGGDTASLLYQDNYSGRAEIGLTGDDDFHFKTSPDGSTWREALTLKSATGRVGINTAAPAAAFELHVDGAATTASLLSTDDFIATKESGNLGYAGIVAAAANSRMIFRGYRARGTLASPTAVASGDNVLSFLSAGYDGGALRNTAGIEFVVDGAVSTSTVPQRIVLQTGTGAGRSERIRINATGEVGVGKTAAAGVLLDLNGPLGCKSYTVAGVPAAATQAGQTIYVSDESGGAVLAFSDGTNWRRVTDRAVVS